MSVLDRKTVHLYIKMKEHRIKCVQNVDVYSDAVASDWGSTSCSAAISFFMLASSLPLLGYDCSSEVEWLECKR